MVTLLSIAALPAFLVLWGLSLFLRALMMQVEAARARKGRLRGLVPLSRAQRRAGLLGGPGVVAIGLVVVDQSFAYVGGTPLRDAVRDLEHPPWAVAAVLCGVLGLAAVWAGVRFDRARGRRRCPACWYDFAALAAEGVCPECGRPARGEADLARTRRSKGLMWLGAVLLLVAMPVWYGWRVVKNGWRGLIPTTVLIAGLEYLPNSLVTSPWVGPATKDSLQTRLYNGEMAAWQKAWLTARTNGLKHRASTLEEAARAVSLGTGGTADPDLRRFAGEAMDAVTTATGDRAVAGAIVLNVIAEDRGANLTQDLEKRRMALVSTMMTGGPVGYSVSRVLELQAPATQEWADAIASAMEWDGTGVVPQRMVASAVGGLIVRNPALGMDFIRRAERGNEESQKEAVCVLTAALMKMGPAQDRSALEEGMHRLTKHRSDAVAAEALTPWVNNSGTRPEWLMEAVREFLVTRETNRANAVYTAQQMGEPGYAFAPFVLRDAADVQDLTTQQTAQYLVSAAAANKVLTREAVERALAEPGLSEAHEKAMRAWLEAQAMKNAPEDGSVTSEPGQGSGGAR